MSEHQPSGERSFLLRFQPGDRGPIGHEFHEACRRGAADASQVVAWVRNRAHELHIGGFTPTQRERAQSILAGLQEDPMGAREYAQECLAWNQKPRADREAVKAERSLEHRRAFIASLPVTEKQRAYLSALGCTIEPRDRLHAIELINGARHGAER